VANQRNERAKVEMQLLREQFGGKCEICGSTEKLEFSHREPTGLSGMGRGRKERITDIRKNRNKYMLTCKNHNNDAEGVIIE
jgi:hypothetical protein